MTAPAYSRVVLKFTLEASGETKIKLPTGSRTLSIATDGSKLSIFVLAWAEVKLTRDRTFYARKTGEPWKGDGDRRCYVGTVSIKGTEVHVFSDEM